MPSNECYIYYNEDTFYSFPQLTCTEGSPLPSYNSTLRDTYIYRMGRFVKTRSEIITEDYSGYIAHLSSPLSLDLNYLVLPAVILVLAFFSCIYHWFLRLRG